VVQVVCRCLAPAARDLYGNETSIDALGQALRLVAPGFTYGSRISTLVGLESADSAVVVTLKPVRGGPTNSSSGRHHANVRVDAIPKP